MFQNPSLAIVMISNGPGELATWVKPIAEKLHLKLSMRPKERDALITLRLVLVPCPNATGTEHEVAKSWNKFEKITKAKNFWEILINPKKFGFWPQEGLVIFLGGDQFWSVLLSARLKYKNMTYAEWVARWPYWNDRIAAMSPKVKKMLPKAMKKRCNVVGDLMADLQVNTNNGKLLNRGKWIALLPGSKRAKLCIGIPFFIDVADKLSATVPKLNFLIPIAPTTNIKEFEYYGGGGNPIAKQYESGIKSITPSINKFNFSKLITNAGTEIYLTEEHPAYEALSQCDLALTTVGANTAELGALGVPMIVIIPTQHLNVMEAWDGFLGIIGRLPIIKFFIGLFLSLWRLRKHGFMAWPNISANRMVVPERMGKILPKDIAKEAAHWIQSPERLKGQKEDLRSLRGKPGAVDAMTKEIIDLIPEKYLEE